MIFNHNENIVGIGAIWLVLSKWFLFKQYFYMYMTGEITLYQMTNYRNESIQNESIHRQQSSFNCNYDNYL